MKPLTGLTAEITALPWAHFHGSIGALEGGVALITGLTRLTRTGDMIRVETDGGGVYTGEIAALSERGALALPYGVWDGVSIGDRVWIEQDADIRPSGAWLGGMFDAFGQPLRGPAPETGTVKAKLRRLPPPAADRKPLGDRLGTGLSVFDTMLPLCRGQRMGVFAGSGVGKTRLLGDLARRMEADVAVIALIGERGREVRDFVDRILGEEGLKRSVVIVSTSDQPAPVKRRAAWLAMAVAEHFRDDGKQVLLLFDSLTRFAEAHREVALTAGEAPSLRAYPPSTTNMLAALVERAGPGEQGAGDITAIFTILVAGSDMDEPVADMARGILDGHAVLDREIAERGRFPAVDLRRSVSRSLPDAATAEENALLLRARKIIAIYEEALPMIQTGLYRMGSDAAIDEAIRIWPALDDFIATRAEGVAHSFRRLAEILNPPQLPGPNPG